MGFHDAELHKIIVGREHGAKAKLGWRDRLHKEIYGSVKCVRSWNPSIDGCSKNLQAHPGAIFNFDFSSDGSILAAACERHSILLFDPLNSRLIKEKFQAHSDCVNCVRFLDTRTFATCSDDTTVQLWDVRNIKSHVQVLRGHTNWVKNIEYAPGAGLLTSGFDGSILLWDINRYADGSTSHKRVFHTNGLMRSRLSKDTSKLVLSTADGNVIVVHDLDLHCLATDLKDFSPHRPLDHPAFSRRRNRVQIINDFPRDDSAGMIASLEIHPQGWCIVSRNTTNDDGSEWTCVHDIQGKLGSPEDASTDSKTSGSSTSSPQNGNQSASTDPTSEGTQSTLRVDTDSANSSTHAATNVSNTNSATEPNQVQHRIIRMGSRQMSIRDSLTLVLRASPRTGDRRLRIFTNNKPKLKPCLLHYIQEPNVGRGYIKEVCFSNDGRLICSPFSFGVRLLAFNQNVSELCDCVPTQPTQLFELTTNCSHANHVFTAKFSPTHCLIVTGCANGKVDFHQPVL